MPLIPSTGATVLYRIISEGPEYAGKGKESLVKGCHPSEGTGQRKGSKFCVSAAVM